MYVGKWLNYKRVVHVCMQVGRALMVQVGVVLRVRVVQKIVTNMENRLSKGVWISSENIL